MLASIILEYSLRPMSDMRASDHPPLRSSDAISLWRNVSFITSIGRLDQLPEDGVEVAFAGRSNAGKSSTLNRLCGHKSLARTSRTPGRTQLINMFSWGEHARLADLPGYGFAKAPEAVRRQWAGLVQGYFERHQPLKGVVVIMDARRPLTPLDRQMVEWAAAGGLPVLCLLNKADKLSRGAGMNALQQARKELKSMGQQVEAELFSAQSGLNLDLVRKRIQAWLLEKTNDG